MDHTCKLHSKCLKEYESLDKCEVVECNNVIHPICCKKLMAMFGEDEWESPLFCGMRCSSTTKSLLMPLQVKLKEEYHGTMMVW